MTQAQVNTGPGIFGPRTTAAVKAFQKKHGIQTTGNYGPLTRAALKKALAPKSAAPKKPSSTVKAPTATLKRGAKGSSVLQLQKALVKLGFMTQAQVNTGPGIFGPRTEAAVKSFQAKWHLKADGVYGPKTRAALEKALAGQKPPKTGGTTGGGSTKVTKPPVVWKPSPNFNSRNGMDIDTIVLHHTASNNTAGDLATLRSKAAQVSAHYLIGRDGTIYQLVDDKMRAWHAGKSALHGVPTDVNGRSIGIEITNDGSGHTPFTEAQYKALEKLVPWLAKTYKVPIENILGHKDVAVPKGRKTDPASNFDWTRIRNAVKKVL
ncbi:MAG: N-acetylmuramoyl-L-alanine amidase [Myxococcaceae bacterium]|nr:N-acetylmuramoyl-L-alanine amidase [Myxococcaceae bacterium]